MRVGHCHSGRRRALRCGGHVVVCGGGASELRCAAFSCDLRAGSHDASAVDSYGSVVPFLVGLGGGLFYGRFLLYYRALGLVSLLL